ncbi:MAG: RraA family protein [Acidobacteriota bacterium]
MNNHYLSSSFSTLSTPIISDACLRLGVPMRIAPTGIRPLMPHYRLAGRVLPVRHYGSVDIFLEAMESAEEGDILVIDNQGRRDQGCIGDLTALEARAARLSGLIVWGTHRDTAELIDMQYPVFSYGSCPSGPQQLDQREPDSLIRARFGSFFVTRDDVAFADADGVVFTPLERIEQVLSAAEAIRQTERRQAEDVKAGKTLRKQLRFNEYLEKRARDSAYTFRKHLRDIGGAIEE